MSYVEQLTSEDLLQMHRWLVLTREFEDRLCALWGKGGVLELPHGSQGQEAIAVGACYNLRRQDQVLPSLRTRGAFIVKGIPIDVQMAGIFGKAPGAARSKSTTHHMADPSRGVLLGTGLIGADIATAVGAALACKLQKKDNVVVDFFGDGAAQRGEFHEGLNFAGIFRLPVVFVLENNQYAEFTPLRKHFAGEDFACRAQGYGFPGLRVDGNDVLAVYEATQQAIARARAGEGPTLLECVTYRQRSHNEVWPPDYNRDPQEMAFWLEKDPIRRFEALLAERGLLDDQERERITSAVKAEVAAAVQYAEDSPFPSPEELLSGAYAREESPAVPAAEGTGREMTYREAVREALREEMRRDERVFIMGEDVAVHGGNFRVTEGLYEEFGEGRIFDTPLSEAAIVGSAVGAAMLGMRPVAEVMYADFATVPMDAIVNRAAKVSYMTNGEVSAPLVIRTAYGAGRRSGAHHSQSLESLFTNVPGLTILAPSTPRDAKGLLKAALRSPNPVLFLEHKLLYAKKGEVPEGEYVVPIGVAEVKREGGDVTVVAFGRMVDIALAAAGRLEKEGVEAEVIDLRSLVPLDEETILASVKKTGRLVIVHEAPVRGGFGGEVAALVAEKALGYLDAAVKRVGAPWVPVPFSPTLEDAYIPSEGDVVQAAKAVLASS